jgi:hypothetical protein
MRRTIIPAPLHARGLLLLLLASGPSLANGDVAAPLEFESSRLRLRGGGAPAGGAADLIDASSPSSLPVAVPVLRVVSPSLVSSARRLKGKHATDADADADDEARDANGTDDEEAEAAEEAKGGAKDEPGADADANANAEGNDASAQESGGRDEDGETAGAAAEDGQRPANDPSPRTGESPCAGAATCSDCRGAARSVADATQMKSTCAWSSGTCSETVMVSGSGREVDDFDCDGTGDGADGSASTATAATAATAAASSSSKYADGDDYYDEYDSGSGAGGILFMMAFFAGMFYYAKTKLLVPGGGLDALARGRGFASGGDGDDDASTLMGLTWATGLTSRSGGDGRNAEMVPLSAATDDDEWGWEDGGGGDVEQQSRAEHMARVKEEEDLHTALAMSLSDPSNNKSMGGNGSGTAPKAALARGGSNAGAKGRAKRAGGRGVAGSRPQRSGSGSGGAGGFPRSHSGGSTGSGVRQSVQSKARPSSPTMGAMKHTTSSTCSASAASTNPAAAAAAPKTAPVPGSAEDIAELLAASRPSYVPESNYISSLSKPKAPPTKKKVEKKKPAEEDDIFASMGLSSAPKFGSSSSSSARPPAQKAAAAKSTSRPTALTPSSAAGLAKTTSLKATSEELGDADWDEDSDLDDLLDD